MSRWLAVVSLALGIGFAPTSAEACTCAPTDVVHSWRTHDHAFVGRVTGQRVVGRWQVYDVVVLQDAKSCLVEGRTVQVGTPLDTAACGTTLPVGKGAWLIFADDAAIGGRTVMTTTSCAGNVPVRSLAPEDVDYLASRELACGGAATCADGGAPVSCFVDPCTMSSCGTAGAVCESNTCGGCTAEWYTPSDFATCLPW